MPPGFQCLHQPQPVPPFPAPLPLQNGTVVQVQACSSYGPVGEQDPASSCPSSILGGIPLSYAEEPYWQATQAQCRDPAGE